MCKPEDLILSLNSDTFASLKKDFDAVLTRTLGNMEMKGAEDATITIKLTVSTAKQSVNAMGQIQNFTKPSFKHDISSVMQIKDKCSGHLSGDYAMVYDTETDTWVLRKMNNGQMSMFDEAEAVGHFSDYEGLTEDDIVDADPDEPKALPAPISTLPAPAANTDPDDDLVGLDFEEPDDEGEVLD